MPNAIAQLPDLRALSGDELALAVTRELDRRDRAARVAPARDAWRRVHAEWYDAVNVRSI